MVIPLRRAYESREYIYEIAVVDFFNARHAIGDEQPHSHSWKVEVKIRRPRYLGEQVLISIEETRRILRRLFQRYEDRFLNDIPPFTFQAPSPENLVAYLFEQLDKEFRGTDASLYSVTIWESPMNYVTFAVKE
ncbi:MAG: 6-carboxytetrahydropterin synthase [Anaerolineae bacterium]|jgi:6-pyruvoyl-tetrahydropterin synthase|nr:6-carboxytetrahydropterin synthase [Anaerolineae bacterium]